MDSSLNEEIDDDGSLLNHAKAGPFRVIAKALHLMSLKVIHFQSICFIDFYLKKTDLCA